MLHPNIKTKALLLIKYSIIIFLFIACTYEAVFIALQYNSNTQKRINTQENENLIIENEKNMIVNKVSGVLSDLLYLADSVDVNSIDLDGSFKTARQWTAFLDRKNIYDKISYYALDGSSIVTVYSENGSYISKGNPDDNYENLLNNTAYLQKGDVYISKPIPKTVFIENRQSTVILMQFATPLYRSDGAIKGIVVADYYLKDMLENFKALSGTSSGAVYMLDLNGFSISGSESNDLPFSFQRPDNTDKDSLPESSPGSDLLKSEEQGISNGFGFDSRYPNAWKYIKENLSGNIIIDNSFFSFSHVLLYSQASGSINGVEVFMDTGDWVAISAVDIENDTDHVFETNVLKLMYKMLDSQILEFLMMLGVSIIIAFLFLKNKLSKDAIKYFSEFDELTESYNRRAGFMKLREARDTLLSKNKKISMCYIDIDDLKQVNDTLGHEAGDELIKSVVSCIQKNIRQSDFLIRMGGDEFLLVLQDIGEQEAEEIWQRIKSGFDDINRNESRKYAVSASHGIEECVLASESCNVDMVLQKADEKMYREKRNNKPNFKVFKSSL